MHSVWVTLTLNIKGKTELNVQSNGNPNKRAYGYFDGTRAEFPKSIWNRLGFGLHQIAHKNDVYAQAGIDSPTLIFGK